MADLLTVYDEDPGNSLIDCTMCNKKIVGETLYKVHLTTPQHLKRVEAEAAKGLVPWPLPLPEWSDIKQYLEYLNPDEPIIGLNALVQEEDGITENGHVQLRYKCKMCAVETDMMSMVSHILSCKHRRRYLELKRPDLVSWKGQAQKQPGLVARAKAALVEKQEGWGTPSGKVGKKMRVDNQGQSTAENSRSYSHERSYSRQDGRGQSPQVEHSHRRSYLEEVSHKRSPHYDNDLYNRSSRDKTTHQQAYPVDATEKPHSHDGRQRPYQGVPYQERDSDARSFLEDDIGRKHQAEHGIAGRSYDEQQGSPYLQINPSAGWNSSRDTQDDLYQRNRFADTQLSGAAWRQEKIDYQHGRQLKDQMYTSHEERAHSKDDLQRPGRSFQYAEEAKKNVERTARDGPYKMQGYPHIQSDALRDYTQEPTSAKRKRKSRFTDATPLEIALTQKSLIESMVQNKNPQKRAVSTNSAIPQKGRFSNVTHTFPNTENVLDVLNDVKIENVEEANFLKEKLCNLLKEFHANKTEKSQVSQYARDYSNWSNEWTNQQRDMQEEGPFDVQGFQETSRYERDSREFQEARRKTNNPTDVQDAWQFGDGSKTQEFQNTRYFEDDRQIQDIRGYEKDSYQESAKFESQMKGFGDIRRPEDDSTGFQPARDLEDNSRNFQHARHFADDPSRFQQARDFESSSARGYEEYERREVKGKYWEGDVRHSQNSLNQPQFEWDPKRGVSAERSENLKNYLPDDGSYSERQWNSKYRREEEKLYGARDAQRPHYQSDYNSGAELYDPFQPSSPHQEATRHSNLEKIASTLLELVARKSN